MGEIIEFERSIDWNLNEREKQQKNSSFSHFSSHLLNLNYEQMISFHFTSLFLILIVVNFYNLFTKICAKYEIPFVNYSIRHLIENCENFLI